MNRTMKIITAIAIILITSSCERNCLECEDIRVYDYETNCYKWYEQCRVVECD
jgi:hypothetical protein